MRTTSFKLSNTHAQSPFTPFSHAYLFCKPILHNIQGPPSLCPPSPPPPQFSPVKNDMFTGRLLKLV